MILESNLIVGLFNIGVGVYHTCQKTQLTHCLPQAAPETSLPKFPAPTTGQLQFRHDEILARLTYPDGFTPSLTSSNFPTQQQISLFFSSVEQTLLAQQRGLEILAQKNWQLSRKMQLFRQEMQMGFHQVLQKIDDHYAELQRDELAKHTLKVHRDYRTFSNFLIEATSDELSLQSIDLRQSAVELEVWLDVALSKLERGLPERLPLRVAQAYAVRAKADAYLVRGGAYQREAERELSLFTAIIRQEMIDLCHHKTLYYVGMEIPEIIAQYVYIYRGIQRGRLLQQQPELTNLMGELDLQWRDKLELLRELFKKPQNKIQSQDDFISLKTLDDLEWYARYAGLDRKTFDIQKFLATSPHGIEVRKLLVPLGILFVSPHLALDRSMIRKIYPEKLRRDFVRQIRSAFKIDEVEIILPGRYPFHYLTN